jgi:hypothetical protein
MKIEILLTLIGILLAVITAFFTYLQLKNSKKTGKVQIQNAIIEDLIDGIESADDVTVEEIDDTILFYPPLTTDCRKQVLKKLRAEYQKRKQTQNITEIIAKIDSLLSKSSSLPETKEDLSSTAKSGSRNKKMKIGEFVQECFKKAFEQNLITEDEIIKLQTPEYSKSVFNQRFEVLRKKEADIKDELGYDRYYKKDLFCGNYHLTSYWIETHRKPFKKWLKKINFDEKTVNT